MRTTLVGILLGALIGAAPAAPLVPVTSCGQEIPRGAVGVLAGDLDCRGEPAVLRTIRVRRGATLDLGGHELRGAQVDCPPEEHDCRVVGPGTLREGPGGPTDASCVRDNFGRLDVRDVTIVDCQGHGIDHGGGLRTRLERVTVLDAAVFGIFGGRRVDAREVTVIRSGGRIRGRQVIAQDNGHGGSPGRLFGVSGANVVLDGATVTGNAMVGVAGDRLVLRNAVVTGNGEVDVSAARVPRLVATTCETSMDQDLVPWGVCSLD
jgi:hypothetical protein